MKNVRTSNMQTPKGNPAPNQFLIYEGKHTAFQSYDTIIAQQDNSTGQITLDENSWDYSTTTGKYRNIFLGETKAETIKKIKSGVYILADLN